MPKKITLMLVEDHTLFRQTLISFFKDEKTFNVIGDAGNGAELLKMLRQHTPDIVITDIQMPNMNGFELASIIRKDFPTVKIIFLSAHYSSIFATEMIKNGINSCLPKECEIPDLLAAIRKVKKQGFYFDPKLNSLIVNQLMIDNAYSSIRNQLALTHREKEILQLLCTGKSNREVANILNITPAGVDFHRQNAYKKADLSSVVDMVKYALKNGLTTLN